jgi:hypothetical protein
MISLFAAARSLRRALPELSDAQHHKALTQLALDGLAGDAPDNNGDAIHAAAERRGVYQLRTLSAAAQESPEHHKLAKWAQAQCNRLGFSFDPNERIDTFKMNQCFAGRDVDLRLAVKSALFRLGCIPA